MNAIVVVFGSFLLFALAIGIGMLVAEKHLRVQQLRVAKRSWELFRWEQELLNVAELDGCPSCRLLRRRTDLQHRPIDDQAA